MQNRTNASSINCSVGFSLTRVIAVIHSYNQWRKASELFWTYKSSIIIMQPEGNFPLLWMCAKAVGKRQSPYSMSTGEGLLSELCSKVAFGRGDKNRKKKKKNLIPPKKQKEPLQQRLDTNPILKWSDKNKKVNMERQKVILSSPKYSIAQRFV